MRRSDETDRQRSRLGWMVAAWLIGVTAALSGAFVGIAFIYGRGSFPDAQENPGWIYEVTRSAIPLAAVVGGAVAVALAIRRQTTAEDAHKLALEQNDRERVSGLRARFTTAAEQLAHDSAAIRLAGVYALAALADDWHDADVPREAQVCIDLLCAYQRNPRARALVRGETSSSETGETAVRSTISALIAAHLRGPHRDGESGRWSDYDFDFTGAHFDGGTHDFSGTSISGRMFFHSVRVSNGTRLDFARAYLRGSGILDFEAARMSDEARLDLSGAQIGAYAVLCLDRFELESGGLLLLTDLEIAGEVDMRDAKVAAGCFISGRNVLLEADSIFRAAMSEVVGGHVDFSNGFVSPGSTLELWAILVKDDGRVVLDDVSIQAGVTVDIRGSVTRAGGEVIHERMAVDDHAEVQAGPLAISPRDRRSE